MSTTLPHFHGIDDDTDSAITAAYLHPCVLFMNYLQDDVGSNYDSETDSDVSLCRVERVATRLTRLHSCRKL